MSKWKVKRIRYRLTGNYGRWVAHPHRGLPWWEDDKSETFETYSEALAYADLMSRTREYALPRLHPWGELAVSVGWGPGICVVHYVDESGRTVEGSRDDLIRHATTLLALAGLEAPE